MTELPYPESPIDPHSPHSLHDVVADDVPEGGQTEYMGLHITAQGDGVFTVQPDGVAGAELISAEDYDDVLELVDKLNSLSFFAFEEPDEVVVDRFGRIMTRDEDKAASNPDLYVHVPNDDPPNAPA